MRYHASNRYKCKVLIPHPRWRWGSYPVRWLLGGFWSLVCLPLSGLAYGAVFFTLAWIWRRTLCEFSTAGFGLATLMTLVTLLFAPSLTAGLLDGMDHQCKGRVVDPESSDREGRNILFELGVLLVLILTFALNAALLGFALFYKGDVPVLDLLLSEVLTWRNVPLLLSWMFIFWFAMMSMQTIAVMPLFILRETDTNLADAIQAGTKVVRLNWRPLLCWALCSQLLLLLGAGLHPAVMFVLAPLLAHGSWWAYRDLMAEQKIQAGEVSAGP
jgi:hypothetical protein